MTHVHCCSCTSTPSRTAATCTAFTMWGLMARMMMMGLRTAGAFFLVLARAPTDLACVLSWLTSCQPYDASAAAALRTEFSFVK